VSLLFTPLDDEALEKSGHILITAMARDRQTDAEINLLIAVIERLGQPRDSERTNKSATNLSATYSEEFVAFFYFQMIFRNGGAPDETLSASENNCEPRCAVQDAAENAHGPAGVL
jgi:hypothetical protein